MEVQSLGQKWFSWLAIFAVCASLLAAWWSRRSSRPVSIGFVRYELSSHGRVAIFRATNSSTQPFTFFGSGSSDPLFIYRIPDGHLWRPMKHTGGVSASGMYTLAPHSSIEFRVPEPFPSSSVPFTNITKEELGTISGDGAFAVTIGLIPGDAVSVEKAILSDSRSLGGHVILILEKPLEFAFSKGWISEANGRRIAAWGRPFCDWYSSNPAPR